MCFFHRVLTTPGQTHGEVEKRITYPHTLVHTLVQPYQAVVDERVLKATSSPKRTGGVALMICWMPMSRIKVVVKAKYPLSQRTSLSGSTRLDLQAATLYELNLASMKSRDRLKMTSTYSMSKARVALSGRTSEEMKASLRGSQCGLTCRVVRPRSLLRP